MSLHFDFETRSEADLLKIGVYKYCEHASTEVLLLSYQIDGGAMQRWRPGYAFPSDLVEYVRSGKSVGGHNVAFERLVWRSVFYRQILKEYHVRIPEITIEQVDCTMIRAYAMAFPGSLDPLGEVLRLNAKKDKEGSTLMKSMCKPRKARKGEDSNQVYWIDDADSIDRLHDYCDQDVWTEMAAGKKLHKLKPQEVKYWHLDQVMNDRGFSVDVESARKLMAVAEIATRRANAQMEIVTGGEVTAVSQAGAIATWVEARGIPCKSIAIGEVELVLKNATWWGQKKVIDVLNLRMSSAKSSVSKIATLFACVCADGRVRGSIQFLGAAITGRDSGRLFQPQNLPRADADKDLPSVWKIYEILDECGANVRMAADRIAKEIGPPMLWISKAIRSLIIAGPGKRLIGGDLSNIEGRGALWLAGDEEGLERFRQIDAGLLPDVYILAYSEAFGVPVAEVTAEQRGVGKIICLACGFQGGIGAFVRFATEKLLKSMVSTIKAAVSCETWDAAWERFETRRDRCDVTRDQWTAIRITVDAWRKANAKIVQLWYDLEKAAIDAVENPGKPFSVSGGRIVYLFQSGFLWARLPSGRALAYFNPAVASVGDMVVECLDGKTRPVDDVPTEELNSLKERGIEPYETRCKKQVQFEGYAQRKNSSGGPGSGKVWVKRIPGGRGNLSLYGGRQLENVDQGFCRDIMFHGAELAVDAGLELVLRVHDELVCESDVDDESLNAGVLKKAMTTNPHWLPGFPLAAKCWEADRYVK